MSYSKEIKSFKDLNVWKKGREIRKEVSELVKTFPKEEKYRLKDQLIRASRSVTANIAEGYGRFHYQENTQFCRQARGSLYEILDHLSCALDEDYINNKEEKTIQDLVFNCLRLLNGYISYLQKAKQNKVNEEEVFYETEGTN